MYTNLKAKNSNQILALAAVMIYLSLTYTYEGHDPFVLFGLSLFGLAILPIITSIFFVLNLQESGIYEALLEHKNHAIAIYDNHDNKVFINALAKSILKTDTPLELMDK